MAIDVYLRNERGETLACVADVCLQPIVPAMDDASSPCLRFIDPYGDTVFNRWQARPLRDELLAAVETLDSAHRDSVSNVLSLLDQCAEGNHLYVWFVGD